MTDETTSEQLAEIDRDMADIERQVAELVEEAQQADYPQPEPETTSEQLAEIEEQAEDTPATEYTPPNGWRVLAVGERLRDGDMTVRKDGYCYSTERVGGWVGSNQRYIRPIEPQPAPQPAPQPVQVREGRWRTRRGDIKNIRPCEPLKGEYFVWPWTDGFMTFQDNGRHLAGVSDNDLVEYLGPIEPDKTQEPETKTQELPARTQDLPETGEESPDQLIGRISLLRRRVTQLEELVTSLRTINEGAEKAVAGAGVVNDSLRLQLAAVKAELANVAADRQRLRVELDAVQQVPADSPELQQLRADLAEVTRERDQYRHCYDEVSSHLETIEKTAKAETVEAIVEWLQAFRGLNSPSLALLLLEALPSIMRSLTGLSDEEIE